MGTYRENEKYFVLLHQRSVRCSRCNIAYIFEKNESKSICPNCYATIYNKTENGEREKFKNIVMSNIKKIEEGRNENRNKEN